MRLLSHRAERKRVKYNGREWECQALGLKLVPPLGEASENSKGLAQ